ncbi:MAG TPA: type II toxin-antitoxin system HipA family toxin [Bacteroidota bacterium]|nr:type II toxin-antitoxin system HipA family toxin [Bacteroidota bacterium]
MRRVQAAEVLLWGRKVGAVAWNDQRQIAEFEYAPSFVRDGFDVSPLVLPRRPGIFSFPALAARTYYGLPGLLADSLPDRFGNALINTWLARHGRALNDFTPVERLCYIASRGMGALEFKPALRALERTSVPLDIEAMLELAQYVLDDRAHLLADLRDKEKALDTIIRVGTSAGGARAKALIAWNRKTHEIRSGQVPPPPGFEPWIMKFDGMHDQSLGESKSFGRIEYAYHKMAVQAGIRMSACELFEENNRAHFLTRRFDRSGQGGKIHMQSLCALAHLDFNMRGAHGYEQAFSVIQSLNLGYDTLEEMYRRMVFNVVARNQDDHTKNIAFLMDADGRWSLAPAFDVIWAYNSSGVWTSQHQMSINGKRDGFTRDDILKPAKEYGVRNAESIIGDVIDAVQYWRKIAEEYGVPGPMISRIEKTHRLRF